MRRKSEMGETCKYNNGRINGMEGKTPFLIGVAGGTASGKVCVFVMFINSLV